MSSGQNLLVVSVNRTPMRSENVYHMLVFEWLLMAFYLYQFGSICTSAVQYQPRILVYCLVFLLFQKLELSYKYLEFEDPLHLLQITRCIRYAEYLCVLNMTVLLVRIVIQNHNLHAFIMLVHFLMSIIFFINDNSKKNTKLDMNIDQNNLFSKIVTPILLFVFNKTSQNKMAEFWILELLIFGTNLFVSIEIQKILLLKECQYFGWQSFEESGKAKKNWNKKNALRTIILICCFLIVTQNLLLIFQSIKFEISVTILHTFIIAITSYVLYSGYFPFRK